MLANNADQETLAQIEAHYRRSRGYVNLTKSDRPNTVQLDESRLRNCDVHSSNGGPGRTRTCDLTVMSGQL
jgi:hypothetical protein